VLRRVFIALALVSMVWGSPQARADVGLVLNESLDTSVARITGAGHSAIYLSGICPETPVKMRLCRPGERGSVISNYTSLGEDERYQWNIVPLDVYLYGVSNSDNRPLFASDKIKRALDENYRERVLLDYCASQSCQTSGKAEWREMVGATAERAVYIFIVKTSVQQDMKLIAEFNALPNVNHFNPVARNCADFSRSIINTYFPHATHRDYMNDFGIATPKAIARTLAHYAHDHPELEYRVIHFPQLPGTLKRSKECRDGIEQLYRSKKLLAPMAMFAWQGLPIAAGSYFLTGRFNPEREYEQHASFNETAAVDQLKLAESDDNEALAARLKDTEALERARVMGTPKEWTEYREAFEPIVSEAVRGGVIPGRGSLAHVFKSLNEKGTPTIDDRGALWLEVDNDGQASKLGLTPGNVLAPGSDRLLAYQMLLAHVDEVLKSSPRKRENISEFQETWRLLQEARGEPGIRNEPSIAMKR
jgi:hypothetical protein